MAAAKLKRIIRLDDWLIRDLQRNAHKHRKSFNTEVADALRDYCLDQMIAETPASPDETETETVAQDKTTLLEEQPDLLVLRYVKRLENRPFARPPSAADLHNWLKHLSSDTIQGTLEWLVDRNLLIEEASNRTKRYRIKEKNG